MPVLLLPLCRCCCCCCAPVAAVCLLASPLFLFQQHFPLVVEPFRRDGKNVISAHLLVLTAVQTQHTALRPTYSKPARPRCSMYIFLPIPYSTEGKQEPMHAPGREEELPWLVPPKAVPGRPQPKSRRKLQGGGGVTTAGIIQGMCK